MSANSLWLGIDTGGTYTDAVILQDERRVIASAKALTTHWDLSVGIGAAIRAVLAGLPTGLDREHIQLVSVSTTLATNAVVENRFSPICVLMIGFDEAMIVRTGLKNDAATRIVSIHGGHDAAGEESVPLDETGIEAAVRDCSARIGSYAIAARFSVRNPAHELRARQCIRAISPRPVTCAHELSSRLDAPRRALTAALNARLTAPIRELIDALGAVLTTETIQAPLMIVKGDGSLIRAEIALDCPVETILSGPAASVIGAGFLTGYSDFLVADIGGTTTDCALVTAGKPRINPDGALIGGWRTMVQAVDVRTMGLGGDSEVYFNRDVQLKVGPRKAMPLSLLAVQAPAVVDELRQLATYQRLPEYATQFALRNPGREPPHELMPLEQRIWDALALTPRRVSALIHNAVGLAALRRMADAGLATIAAFTPSDAMHILGRQQDWSREAAELGAGLLAIEERNTRGVRDTATAQIIAARTVELVTSESTRMVLNTALAADPGIEAPSGSWGTLGDRMMGDAVAGRPFARTVRASMGLAIPLVAIGAPASGYYPEVARRLGAPLSIPDHAAVCNAVGAVAGIVSQSVEILVNQPVFKVFRVHDPAAMRDFADAEAAIDYARMRSQQLALAAACRAGAADPQVTTAVTERRAREGQDADYLAEARVRSTATGRPVAGTTAAVATCLAVGATA